MCVVCCMLWVMIMIVYLCLSFFMSCLMWLVEIGFSVEVGLFSSSIDGCRVMVWVMYRCCCWLLDRFSVFCFSLFFILFYSVFWCSVCLMWLVMLVLFSFLWWWMLQVMFLKMVIGNGIGFWNIMLILLCRWFIGYFGDRMFLLFSSILLCVFSFGYSVQMWLKMCSSVDLL